MQTASSLVPSQHLVADKAIELASQTQPHVIGRPRISIFKDKKNATEKENNYASDNELQQNKNPSEKEMPVPSGKEKASSKRKMRVEKGKDVTFRRTMRSLVNNAQKATDGVKSPPTSLKPVGGHPSPPLPPPPPLPVDLTKLERTKYIIPEEGKDWVLKTLDDNWRSDEAVQEKAKNVANRKKVIDTGIAGHTSFAQFRSKMEDFWGLAEINPSINVNVDELCVKSLVEADGSDDDEKDRDDDDGDEDGGGDESDEDGDEVDSDGGDESA
ncbi:hypothetical protein AgCh_035912 [Apium graveolens]